MTRLRAYRAAKGLTQDQVAAALGVHRTTVQRWEAEAIPMPAHIMPALYWLLGE